MDLLDFLTMNIIHIVIKKIFFVGQFQSLFFCWIMIYTKTYLAVGGFGMDNNDKQKTEEFTSGISNQRKIKF